MYLVVTAISIDFYKANKAAKNFVTKTIDNIMTDQQTQQSSVCKIIKQM